VTLLATRQLPEACDVLAPDGSEVRILCATRRGSMAHFRLMPGQCSLAVAHRTVEELWYVTAGQGEIWRKLGDEETVTPLTPGVSIAIPTGASFQFRATADALDIVGVTMPPWPGPDEAYPVQGRW
jgi:mannose-6-phosphate isomerase-like protein (cupin superfamily)